MNAGAIFLIVLAQQGFWIAGQRQRVEVSAIIPGAVQVSSIHWRLYVMGQTIQEGKVESNDDAHATLEFELIVPEVRRPVAMTLQCDIHTTREQAGVVTVSKTVDIYPKALLAPLARRFDTRPLQLLGTNHLWRDAIAATGAQIVPIDDASKLRLTRPGMMLVLPDAWPETEAGRRGLQAYVVRGGRVIVLSQSKADEMLGVPTREWYASEPLQWNKKVRPMTGLSDRMLVSWRDDIAAARPWRSLSPISDDQQDINLQPILMFAVGGQTEEGVDRGPAAAALVSYGRGVALLWQTPTGPPDVDPRTQLLLLAALEQVSAAEHATGATEAADATLQTPDNIQLPKVKP